MWKILAVFLLTFITRLALPARYTFFPSICVTARVMAEPVVSWLAKFSARLSVIVAIASDTYPVRHASCTTRVWKSFPLIAGQQDTGIRSLFDDGQSTWNKSVLDENHILKPRWRWRRSQCYRGPWPSRTINSESWFFDQSQQPFKFTRRSHTKDLIR